MATYDLSEYLEDDSLVLEGIRSDKFPDGKAYRFASPSAKVGLWLKNLAEFGLRASLGEDAPLPSDLSKIVLDDDEEHDLYRRVMGETYAEMMADGVSHARVQKVFGLLFLHYGAGRSIDRQLAPPPPQDGRPEAAGPSNRATRRAAQKTAGSSSSRASSGTPARTRARTSTRSSKTTGSSGRGTAALTA